ncbi:intradiol ring-cleavage dioxygenase [Rhizoctonia solani AG-3 Rhs1AP]|uniref:Intradiol ring-cleavage dioxygenase n=3 Tax=Rhizoctonia solani TaxID=456999 RepID=A0A074S2W7_9AGAM|nr:intradiol ring-cleavage dioxygenase [Rhizoctonia solani AG-3 Rhs1AP]KEP51213.1 intradiol ring-cleavage dioxygenase [Rhizoctonia solani 123E]
MSAPAPSKAVANAQKAGAPTVDPSTLPDVSDIRPETITANVDKINSTCPDERMKFVLSRLTYHMHEFVKETSLTTDEWMAGIQFLTATGQTCTDIRQEFILLSDVFGVSALVDAIDHPKVGNSTESTVLGPFFTEDAHDIQHGDSIASENKGEYLYVSGRVVGSNGEAVANAIVDTWETDDQGFYDTQYDNRVEPDCRGRLRTGPNGEYAFRAVVPVAYPIPSDGPVGKLMAKLQRHVYRPAHLHIKIQAPGYETLITTVFPRGDPFLTSDAVFGAKKSLIVDLKDVDDDALARKRGFKQGSKFKELEFDFILVKKEDADIARKARAEESAAKIKI